MSIYHDNFDVKLETEKCCERIKEWFNEESGNAQGVIIGISGGKDSAVVAGLMVRALGRTKVNGLFMPQGDWLNDPVKNNDINDSEYLCKQILNINYFRFDITSLYNAFENQLKELIISDRQLKNTEIENTESRIFQENRILQENLINVQPRLRMTTLYSIAQMMHYRVIGTGNASEALVGYFTKWGDGACDFNPIRYFTTDEVIAIGDYLELPKQIIHKTPSDGLCGKSDEENLGITYEDINNYIVGKTEKIDKHVINIIRFKIERSKHKLKPIPCYIPSFYCMDNDSNLEVIKTDVKKITSECQTTRDMENIMNDSCDEYMDDNIKQSLYDYVTDIDNADNLFKFRFYQLRQLCVSDPYIIDKAKLCKIDVYKNKKDL